MLVSCAAVAKSASRGSKAVNWCFTINNWTEDDKEKIETAYVQEVFKYIVIGEEVGAEGTPHLQGFCVLRMRSYRSALVKIMPRAHLEMAKGTAVEAAAYCKKDGHFVERGETPEDAAAVARASAIAGGAMEKARWNAARKAAEEDRLEDIPSDIFIRYYSNLVKVRATHQVVPESMPVLDNWWYYGDTGTGKSRFARDENPGYYIKNKNRWWDGYHGQDVVIIEEWDPEDARFLGSYLKQWADHHPFSAEVKGGSTCIRPKKLIITSNYTLEQCFGDPCMLEPLLRRFRVKHFSAVAAAACVPLPPYAP